MNLKQLHTYLGQLLDTGASPDLTVAALTDEWPCELVDATMLDGGFDGDPHPQLAATRSQGKMLLLTTVREDAGDLVSKVEGEKPSHAILELPVKPPYKMYGQAPDTP